MDYDNIIYPLDKIYSQVTGVGYSVSGVTQGDNKPDYFRITNISNETGEFSINKYTSGTMEYSLDGKNWNDYDLTTKPSVSVNAGGEIYLRGTNFTNLGTAPIRNVINFTKDYTVGGNFMGLSNYETMDSITTTDSNNYIECAFYNQTHLVSAADLNFGNVTTIASNYGLKSVFSGCSSLIAPPDFSKVITIGDFCLNATFSGCISMTTVPDLSNVASIGHSGLLGAFSGCISMTTGPDLSNVTSVGGSGLFYAFSNCSKLSTVTAPNISDFILTSNDVLTFWLEKAGTEATGTKTVRVPTGALILTNSTSGIPSGWTRTDY